MSRCLILLSLLSSASAFSLVGPAAIRSPAAVQQPRLAVVAPTFNTPRAASLAPLMMAEEIVNKETSVRSAVKAIGWRFTAGVVTAITSYIFTKSLAAAAAIVGWDLCSKSVTMFIGERIWNKFDWGKEKGADSSKRSLAKAIAWRIFAACNTFVGATLLSKGKAGVAGKIAGSDSVVKTILFYYYERLWSVIAWGKYEATEETA